MKTLKQAIVEIIGEANEKFIEPKTKQATNALDLELVKYEKLNDLGWTCEHTFTVVIKEKEVKFKLVNVAKSNSYNVVKIK